MDKPNTAAQTAAQAPPPAAPVEGPATNEPPPMQPLCIGEANARALDLLSLENSQACATYFHALYQFERRGSRPPPDLVKPEVWDDFETEQLRIRRKPDANRANGDKGGRPPKNPDFEAFFKRYPRQEKKLDALRAWNETQNARPSLDRVLASLDRARQVWKAEGTEGKFIPLPANWLRERRWDDRI